MPTLQIMSGKVVSVEELAFGKLLMCALNLLREEGIRWYTLSRVCIIDKDGLELASWWPAGHPQNGEGYKELATEGENYYIFAESVF